jgi:alpha-tubulin suppressor-like RCC1 family protein
MTHENLDRSPSQISGTDAPQISSAGSLVADLPSYCTKPPIETVMFGWGVSEDSQLGLDSQEDTDRPSVIESLLGTSFSGFRFNRRPIVAGCRHTLAITEAGRVLSWGWNDRGTLGLGHRQKTAKPTMIDALKHERVVQLAAGGWHCVAVTDEGKVYAWGGNERLQCGQDEGIRDICVPKLIASVSSLTVSMVSCGGMHSVALTTGGDVWQWGEPWGNFSMDVNRSPQQLLVSNIVSIASGAFHNLALNDANEVLAWGTNDFGQLGTGDTAYTSQPRHTTGLSRVPIADIAAQGWHSLALSANGEVYTWGRGEYGRLGLNDPKGASHVRPTKVPGLQGHAVIQAACGGSHTMVLTDKGHMFIWGRCDGGRMGFNVLSTVEVPHEIALPGGAERWHPICIAAGGRHSMCMALPRHTVTDHERRQSALSNFNELPSQAIMMHPRSSAAPHTHLSRSAGDSNFPGTSFLRGSARAATPQNPVERPNFFRNTPFREELPESHRFASSVKLSSAAGPRYSSADSLLPAESCAEGRQSTEQSECIPTAIGGLSIRTGRSRMPNDATEGSLSTTLLECGTDVDTPHLGNTSPDDALPSLQGHALSPRPQAYMFVTVAAPPEAVRTGSSNLFDRAQKSPHSDVDGNDSGKQSGDLSNIPDGRRAGEHLECSQLVGAGIALCEDRAESERSRGMRDSGRESHELGECGGVSDADLAVTAKRWLG